MNNQLEIIVHGEFEYWEDDSYLGTYYKRNILPCGIFNDLDSAINHINSIQRNDKYSEILMELKRSCDNNFYWLNGALEFFPNYFEIYNQDMQLITHGTFNFK